MHVLFNKFQISVICDYEINQIQAQSIMAVEYAECISATE